MFLSPDKTKNNNKNGQDDNHNLRAQVSYTCVRQDILKMIPVTAINILDVGCSNGTLGMHLRSLVSRRQVVGVEKNSDFCRAASEHLNTVVEANLNEIMLCDIYSDKRFDCIVFGDILEHLVDPVDQLRCAVNKLNPGGCIVISMPNIRHISSLYNIFIRGTFPRRDRGIFDRTHLRWFTIRDAMEMVEMVGLQTTKIDYSLRFGDRGDGLVNKIIRKLFNSISFLFPVREFLAYQYCIKAIKSDS